MRWLLVAVLLTTCAQAQAPSVAEPISVPSFSETPKANRFDTVTQMLDALSARGVICTNVRGTDTPTFGECDTPLGNISFFIETTEDGWSHILGQAHALKGPNWIITVNGPDPAATARLIQGGLGGRYVPKDS